MTDQLLQTLERTRDGYSVERSWHRFLLDSYTGGGGYQGAIRQPDVGWWGEAAQRYADSAQHAYKGPAGLTYLDRYPREDDPKFQARLAVAHLWNFVGPLTDLKLSYMLRKGFSYQEQPDELSEWREDVDGEGTSWAELRPLVALFAAVWGWTPVLIDMDPAAQGESLAQARERGAARPRAIPLTPANLVDYAIDGRAFKWAKVRTDHVEMEAWNSAPVKVSVYRIWTPETVETFEVREEDGKAKRVVELGVSPHPFGQVPIAIFKHRGSGDQVHGLPMHDGPARAQKRLYNLLSELDEHMRSQVFAVLVLAMKGDPQGGELSLGVDNALPLDPEAKQKHYYMSPEGSIAETYEKRIEATIREGIYRAARVEFSRPTGQAASGIARAYEFAQTNRAIADFSGEIARGEAWMDSIVWTGLGKDPEALAEYSVQPPEEFGVDDLAQEIDNTVAALSAQLGATLSKRLKLRLAERLDPQMTPEVRAAVEAELDEMVEQEAADRAMAREMRCALEREDDIDEGEDEDEDGIPARPARG